MFRSAYIFVAVGGMLVAGGVLLTSSAHAGGLQKNRKVIEPVYEYIDTQVEDTTSDFENWEPCPDNPNEQCLIEIVEDETVETTDAQDGSSSGGGSGGGQSGYEVIEIIDEDNSQGSSSGGYTYYPQGQNYPQGPNGQVVAPTGPGGAPAPVPFTDIPSSASTNTGIYVLGEVGYVVKPVVKFTTAKSIPTATTTELDAKGSGGKLKGATLGARVGYKFGILRADVGYDFQSLEYETENTASLNYAGEIDSHIGTAMIALDYALGDFSVYAGGGGGVSYNVVGDIAKTVPAVAPATQPQSNGIIRGNKKIGYTARGQAGAAYNFTDSVGIQIGYRYGWFSDMESGEEESFTATNPVFSSLDEAAKISLQTHSVVGGVSFTF